MIFDETHLGVSETTGIAKLIRRYRLSGFFVALFARGRMALAQRLKEIRGDLVVIIFGVGAMLIWAGVIESFFSQYHEPMLPYAVKIVFGTLQMIGVVVYFTYAGRSGESVGR